MVNSNGEQLAFSIHRQQCHKQKQQDQKNINRIWKRIRRVKNKFRQNKHESTINRKWTENDQEYGYLGHKGHNRKIK